MVSPYASSGPLRYLEGAKCAREHEGADNDNRVMTDLGHSVQSVAIQLAVRRSAWNPVCM
jgi:hypothetical protein